LVFSRSTPIGRVAVFCPNLIGDTVMATPTLRALRLGLPDARIIGIIKPNVAPTLDGNPWLDEVVPFDPKARDARWRTWPTLRRLRAERLDVAVLLPNSFRSALIAYLSGARRRVGYSRGGRGSLLTLCLKAPVDQDGRFLPVPQVEYYAELAHAMGCPVRSLKLELALTDAERAEADRAFADLGLTGDRPVVCLNTGGAFGPAKNWPVGYFAALARRLVREHDVAVLVLCGPSERESARAIVAEADVPGVVSLADQRMSIGLTKACVRRSALMVTTDSGPRHFATAFDVPVVTLFGPTHIAWTRTHHTRAIHLQVRLPCGPCQRPVCPLGHHRCMTELDPDSVFRAATRLLSRKAPRVRGSA
jgi:heptosyltransferase-2